MRPDTTGRLRPEQTSGDSRPDTDSGGGPRLLHQFFEIATAARPDAVAVECLDERLTYAALDRRAGRLAALLSAEGIGAGDLAGVFLGRGVDQYVAIIAVLRIGAAYVPMDPAFPLERVTFMLKDSGASSLITTSDLHSGPAPGGVRVVRLDAQRAQLEAQRPISIEPGAAACKPDDLCYVIYTSGTTGRPKGVAIEHASACRLVQAEAEIFRVAPSDRVFQGASLAFDASVEEIWLALSAGATLVAGTQEQMRSGPDLSRELTKAGITVLSCVPTLLSMMTGDVPTLHLLILGGERCPAELVRRWWRPGRRIVNTYGPTETTVIATFADCLPEEPVTLGRAIPGTRVYVLDDALRPVAQGSVGEICIGGAGLARGYVGRPDLTEARFVTCGVDGQTRRIYRTGDLGRVGSYGQLEYAGRADDQLKLRGYRIEPGEIESALLECEGVQAACAVVREDVPGLPRLVAYVVQAPDARIGPRSLRGRLALVLPNYCVPSWVESIGEIPRLPSGKVDRSRLTAPGSLPRSGAPMRAPGTDLERTLLEACQRMVAADGVGVDSDFFLDLGFHSLLAARMVSALRADPRLSDLSVADMYRHPSVHRLACALETRRSPGTDPAAQIPPTPDICSPVAHAAPDRDAGAGAAPPSAPARVVVSAARSKEESAAEPAAPTSKDAGDAPAVSSRMFIACAVLQSVLLYPIIGVFSAQWLVPYLVFVLASEAGAGTRAALAGALGSVVILPPLTLALSIAVKWLVIGRFQPGEHPLWGPYYVRWWLVRRIVSLAPLEEIQGTPLLPIYCRLMGARIGPDVHLATAELATFDLLEIGEGSSIGSQSTLLGYTVEDGRLKIGPITIGRGCFVGCRAALRPGSVIEDGGCLEDLSMLAGGMRVSAGETWAGSPAQRMDPVEAASPAGQTDSGETASIVPAAHVESSDEAGAHRVNGTSRPAPGAWGSVGPIMRGALQGLGAALLPLVYLSAIFPGVIFLYRLETSYPLAYLLATPLVACSYVILLGLEIAGLKWLLLGRVRPGRYPLHGWFALRLWFVDRLLELSLDVLGPLYATVYLAPWYRLLGARLGAGAEVSTACGANPDLCDIGAESFVADAAFLGVGRARSGTLLIAPTRIGRRAFVGNSACVPAGTVLGDGVLLGVLSTPPRKAIWAAEPDTSWLGSPGMALPRRQTSVEFSEGETYRPTRALRLQRAMIELARVTFPSTVVIVLSSLLLTAVAWLAPLLGARALALLFPVLYVATGLAAAALVIVAKWCLMGRYVPGERPLWSGFVWRTELLTALHEHLADPLLVDMLLGTPYVAVFFRLLGARVGRRVYMETTALTEFDLIRIGDDAMLNFDCTVQTHLFEDRVMKMSDVDVGRGCSVGAGSIVLYDSRMEEGSALGDLSLLMKNEILPAATRWHGAPAVRAAHLSPSRARPGKLAGSGLTEALESTDAPEFGS